MPIETSAVGVRPVARPQAPGAVDGVNRRDSESTPSGFRPQTNVSIENAVNDMAGILSKISTYEAENIEKMPQDLQKVIENVMRQAFSFDQTLAEGLGSTMESQRFSMEQLTTVARTLLQMSSLAEKGYDVNISDGLQTLLTNLKAAVTQEAGGSALEPVLLLKASFDLINGKDPADLPAALQQLIASMQTTMPSGGTQQTSDASQFLKQLVQYFMPRSETTEGQAQPQGQQAAQQGQASQGQAQPGTAGQMTQGQSAQQTAQGQTPQQGTLQQGQPAQGQAANGQQGNTSANQPQNAQGQPAQGNAQPSAQGQPAQGQNAPQTQGQQAQNGTAQQGAQSAQQQGQTTPGQAAQNGQQGGTFANQPQSTQGQPAQANAQGAAQGQQAAQGQNAANTQQGTQGQGTAQQGQPQAAMQERTQMAQPQANQNLTMTAREAKEQMMQQPMQNTPASMQTMKDLARLFLQKGNLSQADAQQLQNFIDNQGQTLPTKESRQLETLLRLCQQNIPATVQQAALQHDMPELPRIWAFMQLCDLSVAKKLNARQLKKAGKDVAELVFSMRGSMEGDHAIQPGQRSMNFMMPLYLGENEKSYPAYIHVYDETKPDKETGALKKETWLRLCVLTENLGAVELTCRVYEHEHLDMRLFFADRETAAQFRDHIPELRRSMRGSKLHLEDVAIGAPGE